MHCFIWSLNTGLSVSWFCYFSLHVFSSRFQDYLREQPDNLKTFNIIAEVTNFIDNLYSNVTAENILLVIQTFETMVEFTAVSSIYTLRKHAYVIYCIISRL